MLGVVSPNENFSAGDFKIHALKVIEEIQSRNKQVIICGGTWFYISTLLGLVEISEVKPDEKLRAELENKSNLVLFDMLLELNEKRAREIEPNNRERVIRAIEISLSEKPYENSIQDDNLIENFNVKFYAPHVERKELYEKINKRVDIMIETGLEEEYKQNKQKYGDLPIFTSTIGYGEFEKLERGIYQTREIAIEKIKQHTRNFAKRQLTWLRSFEENLETI